VARSLEWFVARRYLASRRKGKKFLSLITLIAVGGVFLGVTALITVIAVMTGLQRDLQGMILGSTPHVYVFEAGRGFRMENWKHVLPRVLETEGVRAAQPFIMTQVGVVAPGSSYSQAGRLYGVDPSISERPMTTIDEQLRSGELAFGPTQSGLPGVLLGRGLAESLTVLPGDTIVIAALENLKPSALGLPQPKIRQFEVTNTFRTGMYEYDNQNLYVELSAAQDLLDFGTYTVSGIAVNTDDPWSATVLQSRLFNTLGPEYYVNNWMDLNFSLFSALKLEKLAMMVILFLIVLVAAFNIISTLIMVVTDKTREIGILKSMGMTDRGVLRIFVLQGMAIGLIGTFLGAIGGLVLVFLLDRYKFITLPGDVYFIDTLPVALDPLDFALIVALSVLIAFMATIYPARQAAKLQPVDAIRHE
jgi:lipoprotein-releasing system permease protein